MADTKDDGESGQPTVGGSEWAKLSEFYPYGDEPPRLSAGLNDALTDASEAAVFAPMRKTRRPTGQDKRLEQGSPMEAPQRDEVANPYQAGVIHAILEWVAYRLDLGLGGAWLSQTAPMIGWAPNAGPEEGWAQAITKLFLGATYSGPGQTYQLGAPLMRNASGALVPLEKGKPLPDPIAWEPMLYRRIERKQWIRKGDRFGLKEWSNPVPFEEDGEAPNTDPAVAIGVACQHLSTYAVITRGIPVDAVGNGFAPGSGLAASDVSWGLPVFGGPRYSRLPAGKSETMGGYYLPKKGKEPGLPPKPEETFAYYQDVKNALAAGLGPGSVAIYDPDHGMERARIYMTEYEREKYGPDPVKIYGQYFRERKSLEDDSTSKYAEWLNKDREIGEAEAPLKNQQEQVDSLKHKENRSAREEAELQREQARLGKLRKQAEKDKGPRTLVPYPGPQQYDGSHIYAILRKHPTKPLVQLLDVNESGNRSALVTTGSDSIMSVQTKGLVDGCARDKLYDLGMSFAGIGILPPHSIDEAQVDFLRSARPVGLTRIAITRRRNPPILIAADDILYVSRMLRMYGDHPDQNYTVARVLWSLRNTPGFTDVQVFWCLYTPRDLLAKAMWAHGARTMRLTDFARTHHPIREGDVLLRIVVSNEGVPPRAGHVKFHCRLKSSASDGRTTTGFEGESLPTALMRLVAAHALGLGAAKPVLAWDESYVHPKIQIDEAKVPTLFQRGS